MSNIVAKTEELVKPICEAAQVDLVDVEYVKEGQNFFLRVYVDTPEGIDIDQCATIAEALSEKLSNVNSVEEAENILEENIDYVNEIAKEVAEKYGAKYIDVQDEFDKHLVHRYPAYISWDRVHPNWVGSMIIAKEIMKAIGADSLY